MDNAHNPNKGEYATPTLELGLWLRALRSFFDLENLPFNEAERASILKHDFTCEVSVTRAVLLRCLGLVGKLAQHGHTSDAYDANENAPPGTALQFGAGEVSDDGLGASLPELNEVLNDACLLGDGLLGAPAIRFGGWSGLRSMLARELEQSEAARQLAAVACARTPDGLPPMLLALAGGLTPDELGEDMLNIFSTFMRALEHLRFIELSLRKDGHLKQLLPVFALVHDETRELLDLLENRALHVEGADKNIHEALDGTAYAVRMELRKVYTHELVGLCASAHPQHVYAKIENAHGLLRDCFQQSVVALAQSIEPGLDGSLLFATFSTRLEQSLALRRDLWRLLEQARATSGEAGPYPKTALLERLAEFSAGSLRFLMYKDWDAFERFVEDVESALDESELQHVLHRFEAFIETLFGQVNIRAVLSKHPFDPQSLEN